MKKVKFDGMEWELPELTESELKVVKCFWNCFFCHDAEWMDANIYNPQRFYYANVLSDTGLDTNVLLETLESLAAKKLIYIYCGDKKINKEKLLDDDYLSLHTSSYGALEYYYHFKREQIKSERIKQLTRCLKVGANPTIAFGLMNFDHKNNF